MINITFEYAEKRIAKVTVEGHAGYGDSGEDIVCAGISILTISILNGLSEIVGITDLNREVKEGYTSFEIPEITDPIQRIKADALMDTFHLGIGATAAAYGDYIQMIEK
ncbi:MAG: ribosomal-processing cysteine protease Prp [Eubacterium sp.]|nr:ribosomal-processing cysteine protease Prp [Eubacterium sp.]